MNGIGIEFIHCLCVRGWMVMDIVRFMRVSCEPFIQLINTQPNDVHISMFQYYVVRVNGRYIQFVD